MKKKIMITTLALLGLLGLALFSLCFQPDRVTEAREKASENAREMLAQAKADASPAEKKATEEKKEEKKPAAPAAEKTTTTWPETAPDTFKVKFECSHGGAFVMECHKEWAPLGVQRFYDLVKEGYYDQCRFFRAVPGFVIQFGINGDPKVSKGWMNKRIKDDPVKQSNKKGYVSFAAAGPNTRTTQIFINMGNNARLDTYQMGFPPFAKVVEGMDIVEKINMRYAERPTSAQGAIYSKGNAFLDSTFPGLDFVVKAQLIK